MSFRRSKTPPPKNNHVLSIMDILEASENQGISTPSEMHKANDSLSQQNVKLTLELQEANKTIAILKNQLANQKSKNDTSYSEMNSKLQKVMQGKSTEVQQILDRNKIHIEQLESEISSKDRMIDTLAQQLKGFEEFHNNTLQESEEIYEQDLEHQKNIWSTAEKLRLAIWSIKFAKDLIQRRDIWMTEKVQEVKEMALKNIEPEITKLIQNHKQALELSQEESMHDMTRVREQYKASFDTRLNQEKAEINANWEKKMREETESFDREYNEMVNIKDAQIRKLKQQGSNDAKHQEECEEYEARIQELQNEIDNIEKQHRIQIEKLQSAYDRATRQSVSDFMGVEIQTATERINDLEQAIAFKKQKSVNLKSLLTEAGGELMQERSRRQELEEDLARAKQKKAKLKQYMNYADIESYKVIEEQVKTTLRNKEEHIRRLSSDLSMEKVKSEKLEELLENQREKLLDISY